MDIACLGISHHTAPLDVRERIALGDTARVALARALTGSGGAHEAVVLSTCNRTEIYAASLDRESLLQSVRRALAAAAGLAADDVAPHLYLHEGTDAVKHLLGVAAGLDSMILGEAQILGQVRAAAAEAQGAGTSDILLDTLFRHAVRAGRRARVETEINARAASVPSAAVELATRALAHMRKDTVHAHAPTPSNPRVIVVIGAGKMAVLAAHAFGKDGATHIVVTNRNYQRAMDLARRWNGCAVTFDNLHDAVSRADIVIASTSAPHCILARDDIEHAMRGRADRPLVIVDIAVPRDVDPAAADVPNVRLLDVDDLQSVVATNLAERASAVPDVRKIVETETERFAQWHAALDVTPTIAALRRWADGIRQHELARQLRRLDALAPRERELVQALSVALVGKLLHAPVARLKASAGTADALQLAATLRVLFGLSDTSGSSLPDDVAAIEVPDFEPADFDLTGFEPFNIDPIGSDPAEVGPPAHGAVIDNLASRPLDPAATPAHARPPRPRDAR